MNFLSCDIVCESRFIWEKIDHRRVKSSKQIYKEKEPRQVDRKRTHTSTLTHQ